MEKESTKIRKALAEIARERKWLITNIDAAKEGIKERQDKITKILQEEVVVRSMGRIYAQSDQYLLCREQQEHINIYNRWLRDWIPKLRKQTKLLKYNRKLLKEALLSEAGK